MKRFLLSTILVSLPVLLGACSAMSASTTQLSWPLERAAYRPTPLHFGLYVTPDPEKNPIDPPERFEGFHVGTDFEITRGEQNSDVKVFAICSGEVIYSGFAEGYGGLIAQRCDIDEEPVVVLYGHLQLDSLPAAQSQLSAGQQIALLGAAKSYDTDDNRKHLHLGIHRGTELVLLGYVQTEEELGDFLDAKEILKRWGVHAPN